MHANRFRCLGRKRRGCRNQKYAEGSDFYFRRARYESLVRSDLVGPHYSNTGQIALPAGRREPAAYSQTLTTGYLPIWLRRVGLYVNCSIDRGHGHVCEQPSSFKRPLPFDAAL